MRFTRMNSVSAPAVAEDQKPALEQARRVARAGEAELAAIYEARRGELLAFLVGMTRDLDEAEDLLQETFVTLVREARAGRMPDDVRPWLYRVAANAMISRRRRFATWTRLVPRLLDRSEPDRPESEALRSERDAELHAALAHLAPERRAALLLAARGFSGSEIAETIGRSDGATRTLMCRARVELRGILETSETRS
jgi:RNA polymerase sigma-70 factor (ECF subfamily)